MSWQQIDLPFRSSPFLFMVSDGLCSQWKWNCNGRICFLMWGWRLKCLRRFTYWIVTGALCALHVGVLQLYWCVSDLYWGFLCICVHSLVFWSENGLCVCSLPILPFMCWDGFHNIPFCIHDSKEISPKRYVFLWSNLESYVFFSKMKVIVQSLCSRVVWNERNRKYIYTSKDPVIHELR